jgi:hypothetical protein
MDDVYENYCELLKRYQNEEDDLDRCINTLLRLKETKLNSLDADILAGIIGKLKEQKAEVQQNYNKVANAMYEIADCIASAMDPEFDRPVEN